MSEDCNHGHNSASEEAYFYKETQRLVKDLRSMLASMQMKDQVVRVTAKNSDALAA